MRDGGDFRRQGGNLTQKQKVLFKYHLVCFSCRLDTSHDWFWSMQKSIKNSFLLKGYDIFGYRGGKFFSQVPLSTIHPRNLGHLYILLQSCDSKLIVTTNFDTQDSIYNFIEYSGIQGTVYRVIYGKRRIRLLQLTNFIYIYLQFYFYLLCYCLKNVQYYFKMMLKIIVYLLLSSITIYNLFFTIIKKMQMIKKCYYFMQLHSLNNCMLYVCVQDCKKLIGKIIQNNYFLFNFIYIIIMNGIYSYIVFLQKLFYLLIFN
eukprot:TRINITY_DN2055_c0_g1_i11.p4 TRINITY_DN2055_c0_g1~~TRINITY_DN2055_c0_g1_i11.p4  ORF type:complete len:259 (-),score=-20.03 TRINITY_DN2055_c0_g1_i11:368-1144(-)